VFLTRFLAFFLFLCVGMIAYAAPAMATATDLKDCLVEAREKEVDKDDLKLFLKNCLDRKKAGSELSNERKAIIKSRIKSCLGRADKQRLQGNIRGAFLRTCLGSK